MKIGPNESTTAESNDWKGSAQVSIGREDCNGAIILGHCASRASQDGPELVNGYRYSLKLAAR